MYIRFAQNFKVEYHHEEDNKLDLTFSLVGLDTSVANAFRRILIAEVPTLAIENIYLRQNTSIIQDEVLAGRLGLIPLMGNKDALRWMKWYEKPTDGSISQPFDYNCAVLHLKVDCKWKEGGMAKAVKGETDPDELYENHKIYAKDLVWTPIGKQAEMFGDSGIRAVHENILVAKLRPGQQIELEAHATKGIGQDHAKFSPVATASYRLLPTIDIIRPITGADAKKFARCFPMGVIKLEAVSAEDARNDPELRGREGEPKAVVDNPMKDTVSRECLRHPEFKDKVKLGRVRDHFIFRIESTGQWDSDELFLESVRALKIKAARVKRGLNEMMK